MKNLSSYYLYGIHACIAALKNPQRVIIKASLTSENYVLYKDLLPKVNYEIVTNQQLTKLLNIDSNHQGICLNVKPLPSMNLDVSYFNSSTTLLAILDQITDPHNLGAIIRTAVAFGVQGIIMPKDNSPPESGVVAKSASGTLEVMPIFRVTNLTNTMKLLKDQGFWLVGLVGNSNFTLEPAQLKGKICIALGAEDKGLRRLTKENCDLLVKIPIDPKIESLNVSNAASIAFYEAYKARGL